MQITVEEEGKLSLPEQHGSSEVPGQEGSSTLQEKVIATLKLIIKIKMMKRGKW